MKVCLNSTEQTTLWEKKMGEGQGINVLQSCIKDVLGDPLVEVLCSAFLAARCETRHLPTLCYSCTNRQTHQAVGDPVSAEKGHFFKLSQFMSLLYTHPCTGAQRGVIIASCHPCSLAFLSCNYYTAILVNRTD